MVRGVGGVRWVVGGGEARRQRVEDAWKLTLRSRWRWQWAACPESGKEGEGRRSRERKERRRGEGRSRQGKRPGALFKDRSFPATARPVTRPRQLLPLAPSPRHRFPYPLGKARRTRFSRGTNRPSSGSPHCVSPIVWGLHFPQGAWPPLAGGCHQMLPFEHAANGRSLAVDSARRRRRDASKQPHPVCTGACPSFWRTNQGRCVVGALPRARRRRPGSTSQWPHLAMTWP